MFQGRSEDSLSGYGYHKARMVRHLIVFYIRYLIGLTSEDIYLDKLVRFLVVVRNSPG